jgi:hypothetical protein
MNVFRHHHAPDEGEFTIGAHIVKNVQEQISGLSGFQVRFSLTTAEGDEVKLAQAVASLETSRHWIKTLSVCEKQARASTKPPTLLRNAEWGTLSTTLRPSLVNILTETISRDAEFTRLPLKKIRRGSYPAPFCYLSMYSSNYLVLQESLTIVREWTIR